jgi:hypothetical protein
MDEIASTFKYKCEKCGKEFSEKRYLTQHRNKKIPCDRKFQCTKCGKTFDKQQGLDRHTEDRKTPCDPIVGGEAPTVSSGENKCVFCGRAFTTKKRLENHIQKCKIANNKKVYDGGEYKPGMEVLSNKVKNGEDPVVMMRQSEITALTSGYKAMQKEIEELKEKVNHPQVVNNNITYNDNRVQTIVINGFADKPDLSHLESTFPQLLKLLDLPQSEIVPRVTELIHGHAEAPKNHNIYLPTLQSKDVLLLENTNDKQQWTKKELRKVYPALLERCIDTIIKVDDILTEEGTPAMTDAEIDKFEMLRNKKASRSVDDEDLEELRPILYKMKSLVDKNKWSTASNLT